MNAFKRYGAMFGQAVGDTLGVPLEFLSRKKVEALLPGEGPFTYSGAAAANPREHYEPGEWSDDTEQAICILNAYLEHTQDTTTTIEQKLAKYYTRWYTENGKGCGVHTRTVFMDERFLINPVQVSKAVWEESGQYSAPNGGVMRTSAVGILRPWNLDLTEDAAVTACAVTHFDPRCIASAVAVSVAIACLIQEWGVPEAVYEAIRRSEKYHPEVTSYILTRKLRDLELDGSGIGYTYKCLGAAFWALREFEGQDDFLKCLLPVLREGGDTDTNGAVAGALLGAACGLDRIPRNLLDGLIKRDEYHQLIGRVCSAYQKVK